METFLEPKERKRYFIIYTDIYDYNKNILISSTFKEMSITKNVRVFPTPYWKQKSINHQLVPDLHLEANNVSLNL